MDIIEKAYSTLTNLLVFSVGAVLIVVMMVLKAKIGHWFKKHFVAEMVQRDADIKELLVEIRIKTKADRVSVSLFHNGERYVNGNSILRVSGAYESLEKGICSHRDSSQSILVSTVSEAVSFLVGKPYEKVYFKKVADLEECYYQAVLISQGAKAVAKYPLRKGSDVIGFICADFVQTDGPPVKDLDLIKTLAPQIELHLNSRGQGGVKRLLAKLLGGG
jgi:hypothetical protein